MDKLTFSVDEFCHAHNVCRATFYNLLKRGDGPQTMRVGGRIMVSTEAASEWRRRMTDKTSVEKVA